MSDENAVSDAGGQAEQTKTDSAQRELERELEQQLDIGDDPIPPEVEKAFSDKMKEIEEREDDEDSVTPEKDSKSKETPSDSDDDEPEEDAEDSDASEDDDIEAEGVSQRTLLAAGKAGLSEEQIATLGTEEAVKAAIEIAEVRKAEEAQEEKYEEPEEIKAELETFEFDPEDFDADTVKKFKEIEGKNKDVFEKLMEQNKQLRKGLDDFKQRAYIEQFDGTVQHLSDEWKTIFGEGSYTGLKQDSLEMENRAKLMDAVDDLLMVEEAKGRNTPFQQLVEKAAHMTFPGKVKARAREELKAAVKKRSKSKIHRPSRSETKDKTVKTDDGWGAFAKEWEDRTGEKLPARPPDEAVLGDLA